MADVIVLVGTVAFFWLMAALTRALERL